MSVLYIKDRDGKFVPVRTIRGEPGRGIKSIERTSGNGSPGTTDIYTITYTDGTDTKFTVYNGADGVGGESGTGGTGEDGGYYTPVVSQVDANTMKVSFVASKAGMAAIAEHIITLPSGEDGEDGQDGSDGITPHIGANGNWFVGNTDTGKPSRGENGTDGKDGTNGTNGKTPVKGTDYWTEADKAEILAGVIATLPVYSGEVAAE